MDERMLADTQVVDVFEDTLDWIRSDSELSNALAFSKDNTQVFTSNDYPSFDEKNVKDQQVVVSADKVLARVAQLQKEYPDKRIAMVNVSAGITPEGDARKEGTTQEDSLLRISTLYPVLNRRNVVVSFYVPNKQAGFMGTDALIYTEGVIICKSDTEIPERLNQEEWLKTDIMTIAAADLRVKKLDESVFEPDISDVGLYGYMIKRAIHLLSVAAAKGVEILVLGDLGCDDFENNPVVMARAYKSAISLFPKVFDRIEFVVHDTDGLSINNRIFNEILG